MVKNAQLIFCVCVYISKVALCKYIFRNEVRMTIFTSPGQAIVADHFIQI